MTVKLGYRVGNNAGGSGIDNYAKLFSRTNSNEGITTIENYVRATAPDMASYRAKANRGSYLSFGENWPDASEDARWQNDIDQGRMIVFTAGAGETPTNAQIDARGIQLRDFLLSNAGRYSSVIFSYHHEPNGNVTPAAWWSTMENICTQWANLSGGGVPRWVGTQNGVTTTPGVIYAGPNLAGLTPSDGAAVGLALLNLWYPASNTWAWGPNGIQMACFDIYPGASGAAGGGRWRGLPELFGHTTDGIALATPNVRFVDWYAGANLTSGRRAIQNAAGRVLLAGCFEWGWDPWNKRKENDNRYFLDDPGTSGNTSPSQWWRRNINTYPPTFRQGLVNFAAYLTANPNLFYVICYWDSTAGDGTRGPHMLDVGEPGQTIGNGGSTLISQTEMWDAWLDFIRVVDNLGNVVPITPIISSFTPGSGVPGTPVLINGSNFSGATSVRFGGVLASFSVLSSTQIAATVPGGAVTGPISVTTPAGTGTSAGTFGVGSLPPGFVPGVVSPMMRERMAG